MTARLHAVVISAILIVVPAALRGEEVIVPAGTILQCTLSEPNLSSKTAQPGDPVLCDAGPLYVFGVPVLPRGAYLEGHFTDFRNPGHFWGKGWMELDFDRILLPGAELPLNTRVTGAQRLPVDGQGRIHGTGHAERDAVEWAIPVLWPVKIVTLPMRGPRPTLKNEARLSLKLMQDLPIPEGAAGLAPDRRLLKPGAFRPDPSDLQSGGAASELQASAQTPQYPANSAREEGTAFILRDGEGMLVRDYWFENGERIRYYAFDGTEGLLPIQALDLEKTVKLNRDRGVDFVISSVGGN